MENDATNAMENSLKQIVWKVNIAYLSVKRLSLEQLLVYQKLRPVATIDNNLLFLPKFHKFWKTKFMKFGKK